MDENTYKKSSQNGEGILNVSADMFDYIDFRNILHDLIEGLFKFWLLILVTMSVAASAGYFAMKALYVPKYRSLATFFVDVNTAVEFEDNNIAEKAMTQISATFPYVIYSQVMQIIIMDEFGVDEMPGELYVSTMSDTNLVTIQSIADNPQTSYRLLQVVLENYPRVSRKILGNTTMQVIGGSGMPREPANKDGAKTMAKRCVMMSAVLWFCLIFLYSVLKRTIRKESDINTMLNLNCYGTVPAVSLKKRSNNQHNQILMTQRNVGYEFTEAMRLLRARIDRDQNEHNSKIYLFSSSLPSEGKSTLAANIALSFAEAGKNVYLLDMDFRHPSICRIFSLEEGQKGIVNIIYDDIGIEDACIVHKEYPNLKIIGAGNNKENMGRLLNNSKAAVMFDSMRSMADIVIVDTAPSGLLSDPTVIAEYADAGIYIVCEDYAPVEFIQRSVDALTETGMRIGGCILNMSDSGLFGYGRNRYGYGKNNHRGK